MANTSDDKAFIIISMQAQQNLGDILASSITHGIGLALAIAGSAYLIAASTRGTAWHIVCCSIYASTLLLVYLFSTLYHSLVRTRAQRVFRVLDHSAIYLLIAGTYTPFTLISLRGPLGWTLCAVIWALAVAGVIFKSFLLERFPVTSAVLYLCMGWLIIVAIRSLYQALPKNGMLLLGAGGLAYTVGILFFSLDRLRYFHAIWHLFVLAGSAAHYFAVLLYIVPPRVS